MTSPMDYKTQDNLLKAISRWSNKGIFTGWLQQNTKYVLQYKWGWTEREACQYCDSYYSNNVQYISTGIGV